MIAESLSEGLLDPEEHNRLSRALRIRNRVVGEVARAARRGARRAGWPPTVPGRRWQRSSVRWPRPATPASRWWIRPGSSSATCTSRMCCRSSTTRMRSSTWRWCVRCRRCPSRLPLPDALSRLRRNNSHLALVTGGRRRGIGDGGAGGPGRGPRRRGARRDAPWLSRCSIEADWTDPRTAAPQAGGRVL